MRSSSLARVALALALAAGGVAACGEDDADGDGGGRSLSAEEQAYAEAWAENLSEDDDGLSLTAEEASCMGEAIMAELGTERFAEAGVEPDDITAADDDNSPGELLGAGAISEAEANAIIDTWEGCVDLAALFAASAVEEFDLDDDGEACVADALGEGDLVRQGFVVSFVTDDDDPPAELVTALIDVLEECSSGSEGGGGLIVDGIAESILEDGNLTEEQAQCVARAMVETIGLERLIELGGEDADLDDASPEVQQEVAGAVLDAAASCDVSLSDLSG